MLLSSPTYQCFFKKIDLWNRFRDADEFRRSLLRRNFSVLFNKNLWSKPSRQKLSRIVLNFIEIKKFNRWARLGIWFFFKLIPTRSFFFFFLHNDFELHACIIVRLCNLLNYPMYTFVCMCVRVACICECMKLSRRSIFVLSWLINWLN